MLSLIVLVSQCEYCHLGESLWCWVNLVFEVLLPTLTPPDKDGAIEIMRCGKFAGQADRTSEIVKRNGDLYRL